MAVLSLATPASSIDLRPELVARGWFFDVEGRVEGENVEDFGFGDAKGQPEIRGNLGIGRHDLEFSALFIDREERETTTLTFGPAGVFEVESDLFMDLSVRDVRGHYGYSLIRNRWLDLEPFLAVAYVAEKATLRNETLDETQRSDEEAVFPLPGVDLVLFREFPVQLEARASGIGAGGNHIIDVEGGVAARFWRVFGGVGFRHVDLSIDGEGDSGADLELDGIYVEGGIRF